MTGGLAPEEEAETKAGTSRWAKLLVEPRRPRSIARRPRAPWYAVGTVCIGAFMGQLDASIVTLAFPTLQHDFHAGLGAVTWVGITYLVVLVATVTAVGRFADMIGRKLLYTYGFIVFIIGSALCGLAPSLVSFDAFRALQGIGAAMLQANSVAIIYLAVPRGELGRGIGIQGAAQALGPTVGGLLIALGGWRLIFYVNVPAGLVGAALGWFLIPRSRHLQGRIAFDWLGFAMFVPAIGAFLAAVSVGNELGWASPAILTLLAVSVALGVAFVRHERSAASPMLDLGLFARVHSPPASPAACCRTSSCSVRCSWCRSSSNGRSGRAPAGLVWSSRSCRWPWAS